MQHRRGPCALESRAGLVKLARDGKTTSRMLLQTSKPSQRLLLGGGRDEGTQKDSGGTGQGRTHSTPVGALLYVPAALNLSETPNPTQGKETEAQKRLGEESFGKKRLLIRL